MDTEMKTCSIRLHLAYIAKLRDQGHVLGYGDWSSYARRILMVHADLETAEIPRYYYAEPGPEERPEFPLMPPEVSRERALPGESVESFIHRLFSEKKAERGSNTNADRVR